MSDFWTSRLGQVTGSAHDAFARSFVKIPNNTMALASINSFSNEEFSGVRYLKIDWIITGGEFDGQHVFQKLYVFEEDEKKRHKALNMLVLLYKMFGISPKSKNPPTDNELSEFLFKKAGIKVQETQPNNEGKTYNWVSEVHPAEGFKVVTGESNPLETAFSRNPRVKDNEVDDDLPF